MKRFFLILSLLSLLSLPSFSGEVIIADDGTCSKDGQQLNNVWDELLNKRITNAECAAAWKAKLKQLGDAKAKAEADSAAAAEKLAALTAQLDKLDTGTAAERKAAIAALKQTEKERRKAEAAAKVAAAQKELEDASK